MHFREQKDKVTFITHKLNSEPKWYSNMHIKPDF